MTATATLPFELRDMTELTGRLAHVLAREVEYLKEMRIAEIEPLQREKDRLLTALERMKAELVRDPGLVGRFDVREVEEFRGVAEVFEQILLENHKHLLLAREVNARVVEAVREALQQEQSSSYYNQLGDHRGKSCESLTMGLNDVV